MCCHAASLTPTSLTRSPIGGQQARDARAHCTSKPVPATRTPTAVAMATVDEDTVESKAPFAAAVPPAASDGGAEGAAVVPGDEGAAVVPGDAGAGVLEAAARRASA